MSPASNHNIAALLSILKPSIADNLAADINQRIRSKASAEQFINNLSATNYANNAMERIKADFVKVDRLIVEKLAGAGQGKAAHDKAANEKATQQKAAKGKEEFQEIIGGMAGTGVDVIVPFVETATIIPILWQQGVQYIQGHYINKPSFTMDYDFSEGP